MDISPDLVQFSYFEPLEAELSPANTELLHRKVVQNSHSTEFHCSCVRICEM